MHPLDILVISPAWTMLKSASVVQLQSRFGRICTSVCSCILDDPRVPPTNNLAERALRPLVVLRKITFGHRRHAGVVRMGRLMTVAETAKLQRHRLRDIYGDSSLSGQVEYCDDCTMTAECLGLRSGDELSGQSR